MGGEGGGGGFLSLMIGLFWRERHKSVLKCGVFLVKV